MFTLLSSSPHHFYTPAKEVAAMVFTALFASAAQMATLRMKENSLYSMLMIKDMYCWPIATF